MIKTYIKQCKISLILLIIFSILTGLIYPCMVTLIAQLFFPWQANGSLIQMNGKIIGSQLIGQSFSDKSYFWSRPSATLPYPYNAAQSSGSNMSSSNPAFILAVKERIAQLKKIDPQNTALIPIDLVTASGSGLDPHISPLAALYQAPRIAQYRGLPLDKIYQLIQEQTLQRYAGLLGEPRINVLNLNVALDHLPNQKKRSL